MPTRRSEQSRHAFTLVEILIVVVILGIIAAIVVPRFGSATDEARAGAFLTNLLDFADTAEFYNAKEGRYPTDGSSGEIPDGMETYLPEEFESGTPFGGVWDYEFNDSGVGAAIGVHFNDGSNPGDDVMLLVDQAFDDGDLDNGLFQKLAGDRYYYILAF